MNASLFRPRKNGHLVRFYSAKIKLDSWPRLRVFALRISDKRSADEKMRQMVIEFEREGCGILAPRQMRDGVNRPLGEHLAAFLADLKGRGRSVNTLKRYRKSMVRMFKLCRWGMLADITPRSFSEWRGRADLAPKYVNDLLGILRTFLTWLEREGVIMQNPMKHVGKAKVIEGEGYRRALSADEVQRLLDASPPQRAAVYLFIIYTGLRRNEMNQIKGEHFQLDRPDPTLHLPAAITKNRRKAVLELMPEAVAALDHFRPDLFMPYEWVFRGKVPSPRILRKDLAAAGIPYCDDKGRVVDIHALRWTLCTMLAIAGASPRVHMAIMRHATMDQSMRGYVDEWQLPKRAALSMLPHFLLPFQRSAPAVLPAEAVPFGAANLEPEKTGEDTQKDMHGAQKGAFAGVPLVPRGGEPIPESLFVAISQDSATVPFRRKETGLESTSPASQMVGAERFELSTSTTRM